MPGGRCTPGAVVAVFATTPFAEKVLRAERILTTFVSPVGL